jgi:hypothetical protein
LVFISPGSVGGGRGLHQKKMCQCEAMTKASEVRQWSTSTKEAAGVAAYSASLHNVDALLRQ